MKTENWNGHEIRFVRMNDEWWAVAKDVADALGLKQVTRALGSLSQNGIGACDITNSKVTSEKARKVQTMKVIDEKNIYRLVFKSRKKKPKTSKIGSSKPSKNSDN